MCIFIVIIPFMDFGYMSECVCMSYLGSGGIECSLDYAEIYLICIAHTYLSFEDSF